MTIRGYPHKEYLQLMAGCAINIVARPLATFIYNYFFRLGFLDGREGLLLHLNHAVYVSWKYAKAWELSRGQRNLHPPS